MSRIQCILQPCDRFKQFHFIEEEATTKILQLRGQGSLSSSRGCVCVCVIPNSTSTPELLTNDVAS
eukprot:2891951-Amphidinium_carterae.1